MPDFQFLEDGENFPIGYQHIKLHMVFEVKIDFTWKVNLFARGHMT